MNTKFLIVVVSLLFVASSIEALKKRSPNKTGECERYWKVVKNSKGETRCIPDPQSCVGSPDFKNINCFVSPCFNYKNACPNATQCLTDACNACKAYVFDDLYNKLDCKPSSSL
ncbi:hypothetical protein M3Y97_01127900 [Aphelenchoides bicaudatus]|nr:hypothetical protein M3Y97_01127900 [Aphelenchoides bicaudatus]